MAHELTVGNPVTQDFGERTIRVHPEYLAEETRFQPNDYIIVKRDRGKDFLTKLWRKKPDTSREGLEIDSFLFNQFDVEVGETVELVGWRHNNREPYLDEVKLRPVNKDISRVLGDRFKQIHGQLDHLPITKSEDHPVAVLQTPQGPVGFAATVIKPMDKSHGLVNKWTKLYAEYDDTVFEEKSR